MSSSFCPLVWKFPVWAAFSVNSATFVSSPPHLRGSMETELVLSSSRALRNLTELRHAPSLCFLWIRKNHTTLLGMLKTHEYGMRSASCMGHLPRCTMLTFLLLWFVGVLRGTLCSCNFSSV